MAHIKCRYNIPWCVLKDKQADIFDPEQRKHFNPELGESFDFECATCDNKPERYYECQYRNYHQCEIETDVESYTLHPLGFQIGNQFMRLVLTEYLEIDGKVIWTGLDDEMQKEGE